MWDVTVGWLTNSASAAREKLFSSATAQKISKCHKSNRTLNRSSISLNSLRLSREILMLPTVFARLTQSLRAIFAVSVTFNYSSPTADRHLLLLLA
jgi:hypothetical protein